MLSSEEIMMTPRELGSATGRLLLLLRNVDPLYITATATPGNLILSQAFLPGASPIPSIPEVTTSVVADLIAVGRYE